jgi:hypothetical protein
MGTARRSDARIPLFKGQRNPASRVATLGESKSFALRGSSVPLRYAGTGKAMPSRGPMFLGLIKDLEPGNFTVALSGSPRSLVSGADC